MKIGGLIGTLCLSLCSFTLPAAPNLLENGSFELGLKEWRIHKVGNPDAEAVLDKENALEGKQSLNVKFNGKRRSNVYITVWRMRNVHPLTT